ncbi:hypothetical protein L1887_56486 [Cichorium endivia]|nr:hypothetical protein L1887_56486 [Cichorium endivia]
MRTHTATKVVGNDFLGNHIGELLVRQPIKRTAPTAPARHAASSNGSTVCPADTISGRRASVPTLDEQNSAAVLDEFLSLGAAPLAGCDPSSLEHGSESSVSEPSSGSSRSGSAHTDILLHLDQLTRTRVASEGAPISPRVSFVTNFGAKPRRSGSRRAPSETGSTGYFGMTAGMSEASMSPMESAGSVVWNMPFQQSFAHAVEHHALSRGSSQQSASADVTSPAQAAEVATPTKTGSEVGVGKSQSFSAGTGPVRQRLTRAATESTLPPAAQAMQLEKSASGESGSGHSYASTGVKGHRRKPSLVPKEGDQRTFCFVDASSSETESEEAHPLPAVSSPVATPACTPEASAHSVVDTRYTSPRALSTVDEAQSTFTPALGKVHEVELRAGGQLNGACEGEGTRRVRRLRIQPNVQSRPSLLEKTMQQLARSSEQAQAANVHTTVAASTTPPASVSQTERFDPAAYGAEQRTFRIAPVDSAPDAPATRTEKERAPRTSQARTSDWARAQILLADNTQQDDTHVKLAKVDASLLQVQQADARGHGLLRHHTDSHSSTETTSPSLLDMRELLSPPETAVSSPDLESPPPNHKPSRRTSPLSI